TRRRGTTRRPSCSTTAAPRATSRSRRSRPHWTADATCQREVAAGRDVVLTGSRHAVEARVERPDLGGELVGRAAHGYARRDVADRERAHGSGRHAPLVEPADELRRARRVDDRAEPDPRVRRAAHRAVLAGRVDGRGAPLLGGQVLGGPAGDLELRVPGRVAVLDTVAV